MDDPYDKINGTRIDIDETVTVQLRTMGTKILFESRFPTEQEFRNCHEIQITSKKKWNPDIVALSTMGSIRIDDTLLDVLSADVQNA